jgi:hypothetical protein
MFIVPGNDVEVDAPEVVKMLRLEVRTQSCEEILV